MYLWDFTVRIAKAAATKIFPLIQNSRFTTIIQLLQKLENTEKF